LFSREKEPLGCIEFFRKNSHFSPVDEKYAKSIAEALVKIPKENYSPSLADKQLIDKNLGILFKELNSFALSTEEMYDFPKLIAEIRRGIRNLIRIDNCTVYIADQARGTFWTRQSENCDILSQPIYKDTLYGYVYSKQVRVTLPDSIPVSDIPSYDKFAIVQPLISDLSLHPVIGIIAVFRSNKAFTKEEHEVLEIASSKIAGLFEFL
jgi:hypothetical protein